MAKAATAFVEFQGDFSKIQSQTQTQAKGLEKSFGSTFKNIAKTAAIGFAAVGLGKLIKGSFAQAEEAQKVAKVTDAVIKSTAGAANVSAGHVDKLGVSLSKVAAIDDEVVASAENVLLTFRNIKNQIGPGNDIFDQATKGALNLSAAMHEDLQSATLQLGKALNDPVKGLTRLQRVGVTFTAAQAKLIKSLAASGDLLGAQKVILAELSTEFGGAAAAAATPSERLKVATQDLEESLGKLLVPVVAKVSVALAGLAEWVDRNQGFALALATAVGVLATAFIGMTVVNHVVEAVKAFRVSMAALNLTLAENPIVLVVGALVLLGVGIFIAYKKIKPFHDAIDALWQILQSTFHWVQHNWPLLLAILTGPFGLAIRFIVQHWTGIVSFFKGIVSKVGGVFKDIGTAITAPFRTAFDAIKKLWNSTLGGLHIHIPGITIAGHGFHGVDFTIPKMHEGGTVNFGPGGQGLALLKSGETVFTPSQMKAMGSGAGITINTTIGTVNGVEDLDRHLDARDRKLAMMLAAGAR